jgi:DNA-binding transcriptional MerR regulator
VQISELSRVTGVPVATIKYYLREGLLPPGTPTSATRSTYDERHVDRLRLIRALVDVGRLPIARVRAVVASIDQPSTSWHDLLGAVHGMRGGPDQAAEAEAEQVAGAGGTALAAVRALGWHVHPGSPALRQLQRALDAVEAVGLPMMPERLAVYAQAAAAVAEADVASVPTDSAERAARHVVVGTVLYEPVLLALRRLAQQDASARRFAGGGPAAEQDSPAENRSAAESSPAAENDEGPRPIGRGPSMA